VALGALLTAGGALASETLLNRHPVPEESVFLDRIPFEIAGYEGIPLEISEREREALQSDGLLLRDYARPNEAPVWIFVDYHRTQRLGAQIHSPRNCYPGQGWSVMQVENVTLSAAGEPIPACWLTLANRDGHRRLAL
jgi:EpsI family protein